MIRFAVPGDRGRVVELLRDSRAGAGFDRPDGPTGFCFPFEPDSAELMFDQHCASSEAVCLVYVPAGRAEGVLLAAAYRHPFGPVRVAKETLWWIDPAHRGRAAIRMLDAYEDWARQSGCDFVGMAGMGADPAVGALYERRGYRPAEINYLKRL